MRVRDTPELQAHVRRQWREGPFVYAGIMTIKDPLVTCCAMCLKRRRGVGAPLRKTMMPMDEFLTSLMAPGRNLDHRSQNRVNQSLLREVDGARNPFAFIPWIRDIAQSESTVQAWWDRNLRTKYFRHKTTARAVRMLIRGQ